MANAQETKNQEAAKDQREAEKEQREAQREATKTQKAEDRENTAVQQTDIVLDGDDVAKVDELAFNAVQPPVATTVIKVGDREVGPRTYEEAVEAAQQEPGEGDQTTVVEPSNYEAAVEAADDSK